MAIRCIAKGAFGKHLMMLAMACTAVFSLAGCSTNPATGQSQFTALMSPAQENKVGADEHQNVMKTYGTDNVDPALQSYVGQIGARVSKNTERPDVQYKFYVIDTPMVNAFAIPGGYIYASRGLVALANSESELAGVLAHEVGHITGRHSAERYSRGVLTSLGATALSIALDSQAASQAIGIGSDLYMKSYSRGQESEADALGIRYLYKGGYDPDAMAGFLSNLEAQTSLDQVLAGRGEKTETSDFFSTHPNTAKRVQEARALSASYPQGPDEVDRDRYLKALDGLVYGDSPKQGMVRGRSFYHPGMDFTFQVPAGFRIDNQPAQVVATDKNGTIILFDAAGNPDKLDSASYLSRVWLKGEVPAGGIERLTVNGKPAATTSLPGTINNRSVTVRLVAVEWGPGRIFRFQMAVPAGAPAALIEELQRTTYSLRPMTAQEKRDIKPYRIWIVTAQAGDTAASLGRRMPFDSLQEERFRVLNGLKAGENLVAGRLYKIISTQ